LADEYLLNGDRIWQWLDSFWREHTAPSTRTLVRYLTLAESVLYATAMRETRFLQAAQAAETAQTFLTVPWFPLVVDRRELQNVGFVLYGSGAIYADPAEIVYGQIDNPSWRFRISQRLASVTQITDALVDPKLFIGPESFSYDPVTRLFQFTDDPFDYFPVKTAADGSEYILLWLRAPQFDLRQLFDQLGWVMGLSGRSSDEYADCLRRIWQLALEGPGLQTFAAGVSRAAGIQTATTSETVVGTPTDADTAYVVTDKNVYRAPLPAIPIVSEGQVLEVGATLFDTVRVFDGTAVADMPVPGAAWNTLYNGQVLSLVFLNETLSWSFDPARPSPWRFPVSGDPAQVELFWVASWDYQQAQGIDLGVLLGLSPGDPVNPMVFVLTHIIEQNIFGCVVDVPRVQAGGTSFYARARVLMPANVHWLLHQDLGSVVDSLALPDVTASEDVTVAYNASAPTESISVSGTDLLLSDYTPMVAIS